MTTRPTRAARRVAALLAGSGLAAILILTLSPNAEQSAFSALTPLDCLVCGPQGGADILLNLLLFIPMATGLSLLGRPWGRVVLASALVSLTVETLQYSLIAGRDASLSDLVTNTTGGALAAALAPHLGRLLAPAHQVLARRLFCGSVVLWLGALTLSALALMPWVPPGGIRNDCTGSVGMADLFTGTARSVVLNGVQLPCDADLPLGMPARHDLGRGQATFDVVALSDRPHAVRELIHALRVPRGYLVVLAQHGRTAALSLPTASLRLRLYSPLLRLRWAFPQEEGIPVELHAGIQGYRAWMSAEYPGTWRRMRVALSPSHGWSTILPWGVEPSRGFRLATALWVGGLILPAAYWAGFLRRRRLAAGGVLLALAAGLAAIPRIAGYPPAHWSEWIGGLLGMAFGWALHRFAAYLESRCGSPSTSAYSSP